MKTFALLLLLLSSPVMADVIKLDNSPISNVVRLFFAEINQDSYSLSDDILKDDRKISLSITGNSVQLRANLTDILKGYGYTLAKVGGLYTVRKTVDDQATVSAEDLEVLIYSPKARTSQYLVDVLRVLYSGITQAASGIPKGLEAKGEYAPTSANAQLENRSDRILFRGSAQQVKDLRRQLALLDVVTPSIELQVFLIERSNTKDNKSGFSALVEKLGPFSLSLGSASTSGDVLRFSSNGVQLAITALRSDNNFSVYTSPKLLLMDRKKSRLVVGQDVPVLTSAVTTGQAVVQSIEYRSSGVIMEAQANILNDVVEVDSLIEVSSFSGTTTGVSNSPTLSKRSLQSSTVLADGSAVLFGGLRSANASQGSTGLSFLPEFMRTQSKSNDESEMFVLMTARRI
ncbi:MAG: hypothetical protein Q8K12_17570 [Thiobacillus sp.]|nr:hypothetical protein [Thiobacillus sp.]